MTDTAVPTQTDADRALKQKHRAMWASGCLLYTSPSPRDS